MAANMRMYAAMYMRPYICIHAYCTYNAENLRVRCYYRHFD